MEYRVFKIGREWSAQRVADEARLFAGKVYAQRPDVLQRLDQFSELRVRDTPLWDLLTPGERQELPNIPIIMAPTNQGHWIAPAPSSEGQFIVFDFTVLDNLIDIFAAFTNKGLPEWAACILRSALPQEHDLMNSRPAVWTPLALDKYNQAVELQKDNVPIADSALFAFVPCITFILAHEFAHYKLGHLLQGQAGLPSETGGAMFGKIKTSFEQEFAADAWALSIISRFNANLFLTWLFSIEIMFWHLLLKEAFIDRYRFIKGMVSVLRDHPSSLKRVERISYAGQNFLIEKLQYSSNRTENIDNLIQSRATLHEKVTRAIRAMPFLAECYCSGPRATRELHDAVRAGSYDADTYADRMEAIAKKHNFNSTGWRARRLARRIQTRLLG
jgi:hypothetical protein